MAKLLSRMLFRLLDGPLMWVPPEKRRFIGAYILDRASGQNDEMSHTNGEDFVAAAVAAHLKGKPAVIVDVGANVGDWSRTILPLLPDGAALYCFEPTPSTYSVLVKNLTGIRPGVTTKPINSALGEADGSAEIFAVSDASYMNSLYHRSIQSVEKNAKSVTIDVRRGEAYFAAAGVERIDFLKVDVEGHEVSVLRGLESMIRAGNIGCIQIEYGGAWVASRTFLRDAFDILSPAGYLMAKIHRAGVRPFPHYDQSLDNFQHCNYLAMRPDWQSVFPTVG